jgi:hypothetical protein
VGDFRTFRILSVRDPPLSRAITPPLHSLSGNKPVASVARPENLRIFEPVGRNEARLLKTRYHGVGLWLTLEYPVDRFEGLIYPVSASQLGALRRKFRALAEGETRID